MTMGPVSYAGRKIPCDLDPNLDKLLLLIPVYSSPVHWMAQYVDEKKKKKGRQVQRYYFPSPSSTRTKQTLQRSAPDGIFCSFFWDDGAPDHELGMPQ